MEALNTDIASYTLRSTVKPLLHHTHYVVQSSRYSLVTCACCRDGVLEIKRPYSIQEISPTAVTKSDFYLTPTEDGIKLSRAHDYYLQIQGQLAVSKRRYCDFVCWTPHGIHIERIESNNATFDSMLPKLTAFLVQVLLPEILRGGASEQGKL